MKKDNKWIWIAVLAAVVAAVTTAAIILLRARRKLLCDCSDVICDCGCDADCCEEEATQDVEAPEQDTVDETEDTEE